MNWYKTAKYIRSQIRGEFWIQDSGQVMFADGDIGDYNHESYVIGTVQSQYDDGRDDWEEFKNAITKEKLEEKLEQVETDIEKQQILQTEEEDLLLEAIKDLGMTNDEYAIAEGFGDAREFAMKNWGWKRLQGDNVETWTLTSQDLSVISDGLYDAYDENVEGETFNIYIYSTQKWFNDIPWEVIAKGNVTVLSEYMHIGW